MLLFLDGNPLGFDAFALVSHFLTVFVLVLLAILTYVSARVIARDEEYLEAQEDSESREELTDRQEA